MIKIKSEELTITLADVINEIRIIQERKKALLQSNIPDSSPFKKLFALFTPDRKPIQTRDEKIKSDKGGVIYG